MSLYDQTLKLVRQNTQSCQQHQSSLLQAHCTTLHPPSVLALQLRLTGSWKILPTLYAPQRDCLSGSIVHFAPVFISPIHRLYHLPPFCHILESNLIQPRFNTILCCCSIQAFFWFQYRFKDIKGYPSFCTALFGKFSVIVHYYFCNVNDISTYSAVGCLWLLYDCCYNYNVGLG